MSSTAEQLKKQVAQAAMDCLSPDFEKDTVLGIGSGSTVAHFIDLLEPFKHDIAGTVAASEVSAARLTRHGISVFDLNHVGHISCYVDGADEANPKLELVKGGGAALTREKLIASVAERFICIADERKKVEVLGQFPLPVEVIPMARTYVSKAIEALGGRPVFRQGVVTDNGNIILDIHDLTIDKPFELERQLNHIAGVLCNGLFAVRPADQLFMGTSVGIKTFKSDG